MVKIEMIKREDDILILEIKLEDGVIEPNDLKKIDFNPSFKEIGGKVVILTGRAPIWLYGYLIHLLHPVKAIATYDPRVGGAVVIQSHFKELSIGDIIVF